MHIVVVGVVVVVVVVVAVVVGCCCLFLGQPDFPQVLVQRIYMPHHMPPQAAR